MKILLGGGIAARVFSFYNPEYMWIAPAGESQIDIASFAHSIILPVCSVCNELFWDISFFEGLRLEPPTLKIDMGHVANGEYIQGELPSDMKKKLLLKKLSGLVIPPSLFSTEEVLAEPYVQRDDKGALWTYDIKIVDVLRAMSRHTRPIAFHSKAITISERYVTLDNGMEIEYSHLVSTIPASIFWRIYQGKHSEKKIFISSPMFTATMSRDMWSSYGYPEIPDNTMCYFPESKYGFDRVRAVSSLQGDLLAIEGPSMFHDAKEIPSARILRSYDNIAPPGVVFLGRYAEWNPDIVISDVIRKSSRKFFMESIWADQKAFNRKFVNYAPDVETVQRAVKEYILHMFSETDSLLNTINWKVGVKSDDVKLDRDRVLEEWIDVFKFLMSIGHMFGFSLTDIDRMYWQKSAIVAERYKDR